MQSATCPKCRQEMNVMATVCPHCDYDFPMQPKENRGIAYSSLADLALVVGIICSGVAVVGTLIMGGLALLSGNFLLTIQCLLAFFILLAHHVVFQRIADHS